MFVSPRACVFIVFFIIKWINCELDDNPSIIIVGAGSAGIAAATRLLEHNFTDIKILEAETRIGGRIHSVEFGDAFIDLGAEYCHGEKDNIVYSMAKKYNILKSASLEYGLLYSDGEYLSYDLEEKLFSLVHSIKYRRDLNASQEDPCYNIISVGECLDLRLRELLSNTTDKNELELITQSHRWIRSYKSVIYSCLNLNDLSLISTNMECEGDQLLHWGGRGFITILEIMMKNYPEYKRELPIEQNLFLKQKVSKISGWNKENKIKVTCDKNTEYEVDHVIFTPSVGVLKSDYRTLFSPSLPRKKIIAIDNIGYGAVVKIGLHFPNKWWTDSLIWGCIWNHNDEIEIENKNLSWITYFTALTGAPNNSRVLMMWFVGEAVPDIEKLSKIDILEGITYLFGKCFAHFNATAPDQITRSYWHANPNFRGTHSYESIKGILSGHYPYQNTLADPLLNEKGVPRILFAGEATHSTKYSTVHGAIETGYREADRLIKYYKKRK